MDAVELLVMQLRTAHHWLESAVGTASEQELRWFPHGNAHPAGVCYAHAVAAEDVIVHSIIRGGASLADNAWQGRTGLSEPMPRPGPEWSARSAHWTRAVRFELPALREYAQAVHAATEGYVASLGSDDLDRAVDLGELGMRNQSLA